MTNLTTLWSLTLDKLDGGLGMKRVKRSKYEKESVIWMRGANSNLDNCVAIEYR
ncbi:hypothetical protein HanXRQr2_Chr05g0225341 [Helianthus annuus]|uniref:Uncharacterized protein n=1 Tax=Helianthus annuus TaxID=4232 RepID=A0A9K3J1R8_HELAN|nr:hypothetical protein HanXRQr2_Chr05g0225341 [Helianthus annuus]